MSLFLIGYRGSGKSSVGQHVARRLHWDFVDTDTVIANATEMTIREIFEREGEEHFRMLETKTIEDVCKWDDTVIALGGGAVTREVNRQLIAQSGFPVIYLHADPQTLHDRIQSDPQTQATRPALTKLGGTVEEVSDVLNHRLPFYRSLCAHEIDVTELSIKEVADRIVAIVQPKNP